MPKYLCIVAVWIEGENSDDAADQADIALRPLRAEDTVGKITTYDVAQTHKEGFLRDATAFGLEDAVVIPGG